MSSAAPGWTSSLPTWGITTDTFGTSWPGTSPAWVDLSCLGLGAQERARFLEDEAQLYLSHGVPFGAPGFERFNLACPRSVLAAALDRLLCAAQKRGLAR